MPIFKNLCFGPIAEAWVPINLRSCMLARVFKPHPLISGVHVQCTLSNSVQAKHAEKTTGESSCH